MFLWSRDFQIANKPSIVYKIKKIRDMEIARPNKNNLLSIGIISPHNRNFIFCNKVMYFGSRDFHIANKTFDNQ